MSVLLLLHSVNAVGLLSTPSVRLWGASSARYSVPSAVTRADDYWEAPPPAPSELVALASRGEPQLFAAARQQLRARYDEVDLFGLRVRRLPSAATYLGWFSELRLGARVQLSQLALLSAWQGSASSLFGAAALSVPLLTVAPAGAFVHAVLTPAVRFVHFALALVDEAAVLLVASALSALCVLVSIFTGSPEAMIAALSAGPRAVAAFSVTISAEPSVRSLCHLRCTPHCTLGSLHADVSSPLRQSR